MPLNDSDFKTMSNGSEVALNPTYYGGMFTYRCGSGYSNLGYDVCTKRTLRYLQWAEDKSNFANRKVFTVADLPERGTYKAYEAYLAALKNADRIRVILGLRQCDADLNPQLTPYVGKWVEVQIHGETRRFRVGRSTGWLPIYLEIENDRHPGGGGAFDHYDSVKAVKGPLPKRKRA